MRRWVMKGLVRCTALFVAIPIFAGLSVAQSNAGFKIIVHDENPVHKISKEHVSRLFLKKDLCWVDGTKALPVDQETGSPIRDSFSQEIIGRNAVSVSSYWQQLVFSGRGLPPAMRASDEDVIEFVKAHPGAIGYVARETLVEEGVKVVEVTP
jgi:ABC-type phosphate transport system substrate-binding protein